MGCLRRWAWIEWMPYDGHDQHSSGQETKMNGKKKLMVVLGAGASVELGMPSVTEIDRLFHDWAIRDFTLTSDDAQNLYDYIRDRTISYYGRNPRPGLVKQTNFEEILYTIFQLSSLLTDHNFNFPMNAFLNLRELPTIRTSLSESTSVNGDDLWSLCSLLIDNLINDFRCRCVNNQRHMTPEFGSFRDFMRQLRQDYDVGFISLNYDNLVTQACQNLFTGFDHNSGDFCPESFYTLDNWDLIYHLHGSVHFDMRGAEHDMHAIKWNPDLTTRFKQNSLGRNSQGTTEGIQMPTSAIVAGYGKAYQIQRLPFRIYYSQIDEIAEEAGAFLFLGYGFQDLHLNNCFHSISKGTRPRPVVVINYADDGEDPFNFRQDPWKYNLSGITRVVEMSTRGHSATPIIAELKLNNEFEVSTNPANPLSIWYGGFINACRNYDLIRNEIEQRY
jgi:hypothetical protein